MIISHKHKFIFIKIRKTASSSIEAALAPLCGEDDIITPMPLSPEYGQSRNWEAVAGGWRLLRRIPELLFWRDTIQRYAGMSQRKQILHGNFYNHMRAVDVKACVGAKIWNSYFKFCCERNPWDKMLSRYSWQYRCQDESTSKYQDPALPNGVSPHLFTEYLQRHKKESPSISDYPFYTDRSGKVLVDKVIRFENLHDDFAEVVKQIGVPATLDLHIKKGYKSAELAHRFAYREVYSTEQRQLVAAASAKEIAMFGYEF